MTRESKSLVVAINTWLYVEIAGIQIKKKVFFLEWPLDLFLVKIKQRRFRHLVALLWHKKIQHFVLVQTLPRYPLNANFANIESAKENIPNEEITV